jgi:uncharacterized protein YgbK (DUF1537 family)
MKILAIADDLTGALEAGAKFAGQGFQTLVTTHWESPPDADVLVIDAETRHLSAELAHERIHRIADANHPLLYYQKTDSTLRGNIAAELRGVLRARPGARIAYVPAYPAMRRTVRNGLLYVDGTPVHESPFRQDALNPIVSSRILDLLEDVCSCDVFDGETDADIAAAAQQILIDARHHIVAGPAAIAEALALELDLPRAPAPPFALIQSCLIVNGSRHEASSSQIDAAISMGTASLDATAPWRVLSRHIPEGCPPGEVARQTGIYVRNIVEARNYDAIMVFGGDTAFGVLTAFGNADLYPIGEIVPGVPVTRFGSRWLITKAGGFGGLDVIRQIRLALEKHE